MKSSKITASGLTDLGYTYFTVKDYHNTLFSDSLRQRIGSNIVNLTMLGTTTIRDIINDRLMDYSSIIPDNLLKKVYFISSDLDDFFIICDELCDLAVMRGDEIISEKDIDDVQNSRKGERK